MPRKRTAAAPPDDAPTQPSLLLSEKLADRERRIAKGIRNEDPTLDGLPVIGALATAERKRAQKRGKRRRKGHR